MFSRRSLLARTVLVISMFGLASAAYAQALKTSSENPDSRVDLYGGYGYLHPTGSSGINGIPYENVTNPNFTISATYWINHYLGAQAEVGYFSGNGEHERFILPCGPPYSSCDQLYYTAQGGPVLRYPLGRFIPFVHILGGGTRMNGPAAQTLAWGWGITAGGGLDYILPWFNKRLAFRPIQADFQYSQVNFGPLILPAGIQGGVGPGAIKLSGGVVLRFGTPEPKRAVMLGCSAEPSSVHPGDPITVTGSSLYLDSNKKPVFTWRANGGTVTSQGNVATIDTAGLPAGEYTVQGHVSEGPKAHQQASCSASFNVVPFEPPSIRALRAPPARPRARRLISVRSGSALRTGRSRTPTPRMPGQSPQTAPLRSSLPQDLGQA